MYSSDSLPVFLTILVRIGIKSVYARQLSSVSPFSTITKHELLKSLTEVEAGKYEALIKELLAFKELLKILLNLLGAYLNLK
jgi:hypothetical protein